MISLSHVPRAARKLAAFVRDTADARRRQTYRSGLGNPSPVVQSIVQALEIDGAFVGSLDALGFASNVPLLAAADRVVADVQARRAPAATGAKSSYIVEAAAGEIESHPDLLAWGLEPTLLQIVERYIGAPVAYRGLAFRRDLADGQNIETRLWHLDGEDRRIVKVIVYLNDVTADNGPFEYIPKSKRPRGRMRDAGGRIVDDEMARFVPESEWVACTGKRGTVVIADTGSVYHRGRLPKADRFALFFGYNSKRPLKPGYCQPLFSRERFLSSAPSLTPLQRSAIDYSY